MDEQLVATHADQESGSAGQSLKEGADQSCGQSPGAVGSGREEIAPGEWNNFVANFNHRHESCLITIEQAGPGMENQVQTASRPFAGIVMIPGELGRAILICLATRESTTPSSCVAVAAARRIWVKRNEDGEDETVEIENTDGAMTRLHLYPDTGHP
jgi:hypothetical protein